MKRSPYPAPAACSDRRLGAEATKALGRAMSPAVEAHLARCSACRVQRAAFDRLGETAAMPSSGVRLRLGEAARERFARRG